MRKLLLLLSLLILTACPVPSNAQINVQAVVQDSKGEIYANCFYDIDLIVPPNATQVPLYGGSTFQTSYVGNCDSKGNLGGSTGQFLFDNNLITDGLTPSGTQWKFSICMTHNAPWNGLPCFNLSLTITGASPQNITSQIAAVAPILSGGTGELISGVAIASSFPPISTGGTDMGLAITNAANSLPQPTGGQVYVPAGNWTLNTPIFLPSNIRLSGAGNTGCLAFSPPSGTVLQGAPGFVHSLILVGTNATETGPNSGGGNLYDEIDHLALKFSVGQTTGVGINVVGGGHYIHDNCIYGNNEGDGAGGILIANGNLSSPNDLGCTNCTIEHNKVWTVGGNAYAWFGGGDSRSINNQCDGSINCYLIRDIGNLESSGDMASCFSNNGFYVEHSTNNTSIDHWWSVDIGCSRPTGYAVLIGDPGTPSTGGSGYLKLTNGTAFYLPIVVNGATTLVMSGNLAQVAGDTINPLTDVSGLYVNCYASNTNVQIGDSNIFAPSGFGSAVTDPCGALNSPQSLFSQWIPAIAISNGAGGWLYPFFAEWTAPSDKWLELVGLDGFVNTASTGCTPTFPTDQDGIEITGVNGPSPIYLSTYTSPADLSDIVTSGSYSGANEYIHIKITTAGATDYWAWNVGSGAYSSPVAFTGAAQTVTAGVLITGATTGHVLGDIWTITGYAQPNPISYHFAFDSGVLNGTGHFSLNIGSQRPNGVSITNMYPPGTSFAIQGLPGNGGAGCTTPSQIVSITIKCILE